MIIKSDHPYVKMDGRVHKVPLLDTWTYKKNVVEVLRFLAIEFGNIPPLFSKAAPIVASVASRPLGVVNGMPIPGNPVLTRPTSALPSGTSTYQSIDTKNAFSAMTSSPGTSFATATFDRQGNQLPQRVVSGSIVSTGVVVQSPYPPSTASNVGSTINSSVGYGQISPPVSSYYGTENVYAGYPSANLNNSSNTYGLPMATVSPPLQANSYSLPPAAGYAGASMVSAGLASTATTSGVGGASTLNTNGSRSVNVISSALNSDSSYENDAMLKSMENLHVKVGALVREKLGEAEKAVEKEQEMEIMMNSQLDSVKRSEQELVALGKSLEMDLEILEVKIQGLQEWKEEMENSLKTHSVEDQLHPHDDLSQQIVSLQAESMALDDAIYHLNKAMNQISSQRQQGEFESNSNGNGDSGKSSSLELNGFLKTVRSLARRQFLCQAWLRKIQVAVANGTLQPMPLGGNGLMSRNTSTTASTSTFSLNSAKINNNNINSATMSNVKVSSNSSASLPSMGSLSLQDPSISIPLPPPPVALNDGLAGYSSPPPSYENTTQSNSNNINMTSFILPSPPTQYPSFAIGNNSTTSNNTLNNSSSASSYLSPSLA